MKAEKIMIVDDNQEFLEELQEILELSGYETLAINKSIVAYNACLKFKPDVLLLDLKMDGMNGFDLAEKFKRTPKTMHIPIIAMSGYFPIEKRPALIDISDMKLCIEKPFSISEVITQIEKVLKEKKK